MELNLFEFSSYKRFLIEYIKAQKAAGRGLRSKLAQVAGCNTTYMSQVLNGSANLSQEQGEAICRFLGLTGEETEFLLCLIDSARAGTNSLKALLQKKIERMQAARLVVKDRVEIKEHLDPLSQATYYSHWGYAAIHMLVTIPEFRTEARVIERLNLPPQQVRRMIEFLISCGLLRSEAGVLVAGRTQIFLGQDSPMIVQLHNQWRLRAMLSVEKNEIEELHMTSTMSLSKDDFFKVREILLNAGNQSMNVARESKEEELVAMSLDFYRV